MDAKWRSILLANGALVFLAGMAAGFPYAGAVVAELSSEAGGDIRAWRMAHLEGILNGLLLIAIAGAGGGMVLSERVQRIVGWALIVTGWGNIVASIIGPVFGARGLEAGGTAANMTMFALFMAAVFAVIGAMALVARGAIASVGRGQ